MKPFHLDLSKFKKVASDANSTTLQNDQGHQLKVAHKALAPKMRMALEALTPLQADEVHHLNEDTKGMADGGEIEPTAEREGEEQDETIDNFTPGESYTKVAGQRSKDMANFAKGGRLKPQDKHHNIGFETPEAISWHAEHAFDTDAPGYKTTSEMPRAKHHKMHGERRQDQPKDTYLGGGTPRAVSEDQYNAQRVGKNMDRAMERSRQPHASDEEINHSLEQQKKSREMAKLNSSEIYKGQRREDRANQLQAKSANINDNNKRERYAEQEMPFAKGGNVSGKTAIAKQRALEGLTAAVRNRKTGKVYTGEVHRDAYFADPMAEKLDPRDYAYHDEGFLDARGRFLSRDETEKAYGVSEATELADKVRAFHGEYAEGGEIPREQYDEHLAHQREIEGIQAAIRDPDTGEIHTAHSHGALIDKYPVGHPKAKRIAELFYDHSGFVDKAGRFMTREEADKKFEARTSEEFKRKQSKVAQFHNSYASGGKVATFKNGGNVADNGQTQAAEDNSIPQNPSQPVININVGGQQASGQPQASVTSPLAGLPEHVSDKEQLYGAEAPTQQPKAAALPEVAKSPMPKAPTNAAQPTQANIGALPPEPKVAATPESPQVNPVAGGPQALEEMPSAPGPLQDAWMTKAASGEYYLNPQQMLGAQTINAMRKGQGMMDEAAAQGKISQAEAAALKADTAAMHVVTTKYDATFGEITNNFRDLQDYITKHPVDAKRYLQSMSTGSKIATGIGMLLSGLGGNRGNDNSVMKFLNDQIARDIDAQKDDLGRKETMYSENLQRYGQANTAYQVTMAQHQIMLANDLQRAGLSQGNAIAQARIAQIHADTMNNALNIAHQASMSAAIFGAQQQQGNAANGQQQPAQDPMKIISYYQLTDPAKAKELEARAIPNVGFAKIPVPPDEKDAIAATPRFLDKLQALARFTQQHGGVFNGAAAKIPGTEAYNLAQQGMTMAADALSDYRLAKNQGVFKQSSQEFDRTIIPDNPLSIFALVRDLPRYRTALDLARKDYQVKLDKYGMTNGPYGGQKIMAPSATPSYSPTQVK